MSAATQIGRVLAGKYRLDHVLGSGGMGTVVAATHLGLGRKVALKFMRLGLVDDAESIGRFTREARAAATLRGEHVAQVMDVEVDADNGAPYIVMEYLEGSDLASVLGSRGPLAADDAVSYLLQACEGLAEAHANGIVHRDLKPANLFLTHRPDGSPLVKVLDFGVSKLNEAAQSGSFHLTQPRKAIGSPQYMSPEQMIASPEVDQRADIWALGVILYELLAGQPPFVAGSFLELSLEVTNRAPPPLLRRVPGLAPGLVAVVERCLQKAPAGRFSDVAALAAALAPHAGPGAEASAARIARTLGVQGRTVELLPPLAVAAEETKRAGGGRRLALAGLGAAGLAVLALLIWRGGDPEPAPVPVAPLPAVEPPQAKPAPPTPTPSVPEAAPKPTGSGARKRPRKVDRASTASAPLRESEPPPPASTTPADKATPTKRGPVITDL